MQNKSAMLSTFCGAFDIPHRKKEDKVVHAMIASYNQIWKVLHCLIRSFEQKSKLWSKEVVFNLVTHLLMNSYILSILIVGHPKTRLQSVKDVLDSLASDYKEIEAVSVASNKDIANLPGKKENDCIICSD